MNKEETGNNGEKTVSETVRENYRTAAVFKRYSINYCCGGKWPVSMLCENAGVSIHELRRELILETTPIQPVVYRQVLQWSVSFLSTFIKEVYYSYFEKQLPHILSEIENFADGHRKKFPFLRELEPLVHEFGRSIKECLEFGKRDIDNTVQLPKIGHYSFIFLKNKECLLVLFSEMRWVTENFTMAETACTSHRVAFNLLKEMEAMLKDVFFLEEKLLERVNADSAVSSLAV
ncbi:MAG: DUF542 domain-containing protein [Chitinophagaceae bacterium]|nr:DUF542 domain-containing protein [Bacteroidota bacterium]MCC6256972.1 DUF542 domain-containing protein [Chitinophagaceae bacterium]MCW5916333.1 DUF542 domain-containing protein [Ferruginibacter sp.]